MSVSVLKKGALVELFDVPTELGNNVAWNGMLCRVKRRGFFPTDAVLEPVSERPDGGYAEFCWPTNRLRRVLR